MAFWKRSEPEPPRVSEQLLAAVAAQLPEADPITVELVAAISGLLACVAYSDRKLHDAEREKLRAVLSQVHAMTEGGPAAIVMLLERHLTELTVINPQAYTRTLREHGDRQLRLEVLDTLLELATADAELAFAETQLLRRLTSALGLTQEDYNAAQAQQRARH